LVVEVAAAEAALVSSYMIENMYQLVRRPVSFLAEVV